tara:strand:+ start:2053 stop:2280 length:228 start_codon:yes stop_codon:yes gene_type:complete
MEEALIREVRKVVPSFMKIGKQMWIDYDKGADVLYISFEKPQHAEDSEMEDDIIVHKRKDKVVGLTVLHASKFSS